MARQIVRIELADGSQMARPVMRALCNSKKITLVTGEDFDDHDLWNIEDRNAALLGTLTEAAYQRVIGTKTKESITLNEKDFSWVNGQNPMGTATLQAVTCSMIKLDLADAFRART